MIPVPAEAAKSIKSDVSLSLKESEQRFSEHNLEVIAERYNGQKVN